MATESNQSVAHACCVCACTAACTLVPAVAPPLPAAAPTAFAQLCDLYESDCIFDKFDCVMSGDGRYFATGTYSNFFRWGRGC